MSSETNKALSRRSIEEAWNQGNLNLINEFVAPDVVFYDPSIPTGEVRGLEAAKQERALYYTAFPDLRFTIDDMIAEGEEVVVRYTARGTHRGALFGVAPTGKTIVMQGVMIDQYANGKLIKCWNALDRFGVLQQLGVLPPLPVAVK